jgi:hypothetical protein
MTTVVVDEVLLAGLGSSVVADTVAVFTRIAGPFVRAIIVTVSVSPLVSVPRLQVIVEAEIVQVPFVDVALGLLRPAGRMSRTVTPSAVFGPLFVIVSR